MPLLSAYEQELKPSQPCKSCGNSFIPRGGKRLFCSKQCYYDTLTKEGQERRGGKRCEYCNRFFHLKRYNQRYCQPECYYNQARVRKEAKKETRTWKPEQKQCPHCTSFFLQKSANHNFCTRACYKQAKKHKVWLRLKANSREDCLTCGGPLPALGRVYCSAFCRNKYKWIARQIHEKTCVMCGNSFKSHNIRAMNCSRACSVRYGNQKRSHERLLSETAEEKREELRQRQEKRVKLSKLLPGETAFSDAIEAFLKRGGLITQYQPQGADDANTAVPQNFWHYDQYDAEI